MPRTGNQNAKRHGHTHRRGVYQRTLTYNTWRTMKERCYREGHKWFDRYGGRGIRVCDRWLGKQGFANFLADMGERPGKGMTLHRERVNDDYCKDNCEWASKWKQNVDLPRQPDGRYGGSETCPESTPEPVQEPVEIPY